MTRLHIAVLAAAGGILVFLLFVRPSTGLADQGDYGRVMTTFKLAYPPEMPKADRYFCYVQTKYIISPQRRPGSSRLPYFSSELLFAGAAVALHSILLRFSEFDIRLLGRVHAVAFLSGLSLVLYSSRGLRGAEKLLLAVLCLLIGCDAGYLTYFNSFFSEPASYIFGLTFIGSTLLLIQAPERNLRHLALSAISAALLVTAKPQNLPLAMPIAGFFLICIRPLEPGPRRWRRASAISVLLLFCLALFSYRRVPEDIKRENLYESIFSELLPRSPDPQGDLRVLGLRPDLARYAGTNSWSAGAFPGAEIYRGGETGRRLLIFYLSHPVRLWHLIAHGVEASLSNRYNYLGNYERSSGMPCKSLTTSFAAWDNLRSRLNRPWLLALFFPANSVLPVWLSSRQKGRVRTLFHFHALVAVMAVMSFLVAVLGAGIETQKHLFFFNFLFDCCLTADLLWLCHLVSVHTKRQPFEAAISAS